MQDLTVLHHEEALSSAHGFLSSEALDVFSKVSLPHLTRLLVINPLSTIVAKVRLTFCEDGSSIDDYAQISRAVSRRFQPHGSCSCHPSPFVPIDIHFCAPEHDVWDPRLSMDYPQLDRGIPLVVFVVMEHQSTTNREHIVNSIYCSIPPTDVQTIYFNEPPLSVDF